MKPNVTKPGKEASFKFVETQSEFFRFLIETDKSAWIGCDTEFISEGRYLPDLCLVQVSTEAGDYILDPLAIRDLTPFWERFCREDTLAVVHACRSELEFCYRAVKRLPPKIFDVQLAAAFVGLGYPLNFKSLAAQTIRVNLEKSETLTDWSRRPLLSAQLQYALQDVCYLWRIVESLQRKLDAQGRSGWFQQEMSEYVASLQTTFVDESWRKITGPTIKTRTELATVRELWRWRRDRAIARNTPPHRVMRDDLIVALAKRHSADPERVAVTRGLSGKPDSPWIREICGVIQKALNLPDDQKPKMESVNYPVYKIASQLVCLLLTQYCQRRQISPSVVMTTRDVREAIAAHQGTLPADITPRLKTGWRAEFIGEFLDNVLNGRYAMQITGELEENPIRLIDVGELEARAVFDVKETGGEGGE